MKSSLMLLALTATATALPASYVEENHGLLWASFKAEHGKTYDAAEEPHRMAVFKANMLKASALEAGSKTGARFGMNKFSDMTEEEFRGQYHNLNIPYTKRVTASRFTESEKLQLAGASKDWRKEGAVVHVKNQAQCGSCWAFSQVGALEGANFLAGHTLTSGSEQHLVSCDKNDMGCSGSYELDKAYQWLIDNNNGELVTEEAYPYVSGNGNVPRCAFKSSMAVAATVTDYTVVPQNEDELAASLIKNGPHSITIDATSWQTYQGGVMDNCISDRLDHGVLAVGVTPDYWIVKNSWGTSWGESGYIRLQRGTNQCLIDAHGLLPKAA